MNCAPAIIIVSDGVLVLDVILRRDGFILGEDERGDARGVRLIQDSGGRLDEWRGKIVSLYVNRGCAHLKVKSAKLDSSYIVSEPHPRAGGQVQRGGEPGAARATTAGGDGHTGSRGIATASTTS